VAHHPFQGELDHLIDCIQEDNRVGHFAQVGGG